MDNSLCALWLFCRRLKPPELTPPQSQSPSLSQSPVNGTIWAVTAATDNTRLNTATDCARLMFPSLHCPSLSISLSLLLSLTYCCSAFVFFTFVSPELDTAFVRGLLISCCVLLRPTRKLQLNCAARCRLVPC